MTAKTATTPAVWIGLLHAYNCGRLIGEWTDAADLDRLREVAARVLAEGGGEEVALIDFGDFFKVPDNLAPHRLRGVREQSRLRRLPLYRWVRLPARLSRAAPPDLCTASPCLRVGAPPLQTGEGPPLQGDGQMHSQATTYVLDGLRPRKVRIDVYANSGGSAFTIFGLQPGDGLALQAVVRKAIGSSGFSFPTDRHVSVRVSAADGRPSGREGMAMPIALAVLAASGQLRRDTLAGLAVAGNMLEDGTIAAVRGALQMAEAVAEDPSLSCFALASASAPEGACARGVEVLQLYSLAAARYISDSDRDRLRPEPQALPSTPDPYGPDFRDIKGQGPARRACEVAAAGDHSLLLAAPRGAGQAPLARRLPSILPPLRRSEALEVLRIASSMGTGSVATGRPFRSIPANTGIASMLGFGSPLSPGEVTLAHNGVLFLDQLEAFDIETLRGIAASRSAGRTFVGSPPKALPSSFSLIAATHCCPCGRLGGGEWSCSCEGRALARHLDRLAEVAAQIDLVCTYTPPSEEELAAGPGEPSCAIRSRVIEARARQAARLGEGRTNRQMTIAETEECGLSAEALDAVNRLLPYPDQVGRRICVVQVARTVADLSGADQVDSFHLAEAIELQLQPVGGDPASRPMDPGNSPGVGPTS